MSGRVLSLADVVREYVERELARPPATIHETIPDLHWDDLVAREPRLADLGRDVRAVTPGDDPHFCANEVWAREIKPRLVELVGWGSNSPYAVLRTSRAYEVAYSWLYEQLPPCRDCLCL